MIHWHARCRVDIGRKGDQTLSTFQILPAVLYVFPPQIRQPFAGGIINSILEIKRLRLSKLTKVTRLVGGKKKKKKTTEL